MIEKCLQSEAPSFLSAALREIYLSLLKISTLSLIYLFSPSEAQRKKERSASICSDPVGLKEPRILRTGHFIIPVRAAGIGVRMKKVRTQDFKLAQDESR